MKRSHLLLIVLAVAGLALLILPPLLGAVTAARAAGGGGAPVCIGLIVTSCSTAPVRTSPVTFVAVLTLGAWGTMWMSRHVAEEEEEEEEGETGGQRVSEGNAYATAGRAGNLGDEVAGVDAVSGTDA